tara:strand:+ start:508 stop:837 length:330 start_codon:yes stop_codon:yes gene_type:complete
VGEPIVKNLPHQQVKEINMYTGTEPEKNAVHDAIKDVVPNFEAIGWETKIREISSDQIFNLITTLLVSYKNRLNERIQEDVTESRSIVLEEKPDKNKKYDTPFDDDIPF